MRRIFTSTTPTIITGIAGVITLISLAASILIGAAPVTSPRVVGLVNLRVVLVDVAVIVAAVAIVMGFVHLMYVHVRRIGRGKGVFYSIVLIMAALATLAVLIIERISGDQRFTRLIFDNVIVSTQSALGALLAVFLALAAFRMLWRRRSMGGVWFLLSAFVVLITQVPLPVFGDTPNALSLARSVLDAITTGGMRGLVLGVAIGTLATAFRVLFFIDRPQSE